MKFLIIGKGKTRNKDFSELKGEWGLREIHLSQKDYH
jgi:hypothetical protein